MPLSTKQSRENGQSLVEVALTLPLLIFIMAVVIDLGRVYYTFIALEDAANEAAIFLTSSNPWCRFESDIPPAQSEVRGGVVPPDSCVNPRNAFYRARNSGIQEVNWDLVRDQSRITFLDDDLNLYRALNSQIDAGSQITVRITYPLNAILITPIIRDIAAGQEIFGESSQQIVNIGQ